MPSKKSAHVKIDVPYIEDDSLITGEGLSLRWIPVAKIPDLLWEDNPKSHDLGKTWESVVKNGFADPAKWDNNLMNRAGGQGALVFGNGRCEAVWWGWGAYQRGEWKGDIPRGIGTDEQGNWYIQCKFGLDAISEAAAAAFAIDHNVLTLSGGDYDIAGMLAMFDEKGLAKVWKGVSEQGESLLTLDGDDLDGLLEFLDKDASSDGSGDSGNGDGVVHQKLSDRFLIPPFSILDARQGYWQERKSLWIGLGIQSELGRGSDITYGDAPEITSDGLNPDNNLSRQTKANAIPGGSLQDATSLGKDGKTQRGDGTGKAIKINGKLPAAIGGSPLPLDRMKNGKRQPAAFGQDLMRGEGQINKPETASLKGGLTSQTSIHPYDATGQKRNNAPRIQLNNPTKDSSNPTSIQNVPAYYYKRERGMSDEEIMAAYIANGGGASVSGTSIFDPVLCELAYTWFTPKAAHILDPFAGGSVRGIVASILGRDYTGIDLREEQISANREQGAILAPENPPQWIAGDSLDIQALAPGTYDFIFSCPPYGDLEIYSEDERDISNMDYPAFLETYRRIISESCAMLSDNRFACFVVGDIRDKKGNYRNFVSDTIQAFLDAGLNLYNEAILVTSLGSLPIRAGKQFESGRKLGKTHQNVLVFIKGDFKKAVEFCGAVDVYIPDAIEANSPAEDTGEADYGNRLILP